MRFIMRIYYQVLGGHTHINIWTGKHGCSLGKAGELIMTNEEFSAWQDGRIITEWVQSEKIAQANPYGDTGKAAT